MIEVKGMNKDEHGVLTFDGNVIEIFGFGTRQVEKVIPSRRIHIDQLMGLVKEGDGYGIAYEGGVVYVHFTEGGENLEEFIESLVSASPNPDLVVK